MSLTHESCKGWILNSCREVLVPCTQQASFLVILFAFESHFPIMHFE